LVRVFGHDPFENANVLRKMCFIRDNQRYPDDYRLSHVLRVLPAFHDTWDAALAERIAATLRIPAKTRIRKFSRGQLSAVAILIGLASRAPVTIFDEPYLGLDATARRAFYDLLIADLAAHPRTVLVSTHLIDEMESLLERVVILDRGRVVLDADLDEARERAVTVSGTAAAVDDATRGRRILHSQALGARRSVTVEASPDDPELSARDDIQLSPVGLQDLVAAYGESPEPAALEWASR
jgi:ABC-2 type transport system ATP-binding protein